MHSRGKLYLLPVPLLDSSGLQEIPEHNLQIAKSLDCFIAEDAKTARKNLKLFGYPDLNVQILILNEHTAAQSCRALLQPMLEGRSAGLMSDAGCPGVADPGADLVRHCHGNGIAVVPLSGPSSITMSVMASGFNGQSFAFNGYLPVDKAQRARRIKELEQLAQKGGQAQYFIETPYRSQQMFESLIACLQPDTLLFVGCNIGSVEALLLSLSAERWKKRVVPALHKLPAVFGIFR